MNNPANLAYLAAKHPQAREIERKVAASPTDSAARQIQWPRDFFALVDFFEKAGQQKARPPIWQSNRSIGVPHDVRKRDAAKVAPQTGSLH